MHRRGATRADVVACAVVVGLLGVLLASTTIENHGPIDWRVGCQLNLQGIGWAFAACEAENNGFVPTGDDGAATGPSGILLSWADFLYDEDYLSSTRHQICPADAHPDPLAAMRASAWGYRFVDEFGVGEQPRPGVRSSYAINDVLSYNWPEDRYLPDLSRQVRAMDGAWTWMTCINAIYLYRTEILGIPTSPDTPTWYGNMQAWRHGDDFGANALMIDGSVGRLTPIFPDWTRDPTFDTEQAFTWLPGEETDRYVADSYQGTHTEWLGQRPQLATGGVNPAMPDALDLSWRSENNAWVKLPNPDERLSRNAGLLARPERAVRVENTRQQMPDESDGVEMPSREAP